MGTVEDIRHTNSQHVHGGNFHDRNVPSRNFPNIIGKVGIRLHPIRKEVGGLKITFFQGPHVV